MNPSRYIVSSDGFTCYDDLIPRVPRRGDMPTFNPGPELGHRTAAFEQRVLDARSRLKSGEPPSSIRADHGAIVLRAAAFDDILGERLRQSRRIDHPYSRRVLNHPAPAKRRTAQVQASRSATVH